MGEIQRQEYFEALKNVPQIFNAMEKCLEGEEATYKTVCKLCNDYNFAKKICPRKY